MNAISFLTFLFLTAPTPVQPPEAIQAAKNAPQVPPSLAALTRELCVPPSPTLPAPTRIATARLWATQWDTEGRPQGPRQTLIACLGQSALGQVALAAADDLTGAWESAQARCAQALPQSDGAYQGALWRCQATAAAHMGQVERGIALLREGIAKVPEAGELYIALAQAQLAAGDPHGAHASLMPLLQLPHGSDVAVLKRARTLADAARDAAAPPLTPLDLIEQTDLNALMQATQHDADDVAHVREVATQGQQPRLWPACALILLRGADPALGRDLLARAETALPLDADPSRLLAVYHLAGTDYPGALTALLRAVRKQPFDPESQVMLASVAQRTGEWALAESAYRALVQLEPDRETHRTGLAHAMAEHGKKSSVN